MNRGVPKMKNIPEPPPKKIKEIDIEGGKLTFGQRIDLGKLMCSEYSEVEKFEKTFEILHEVKLKISEYKKHIDYFATIIEGLKFWSEQEATLLKYEPTQEEKQAGIKDFSQKVGEFATVKALAKAYSKDPDEILNWEYGKVFGILYTDLEEHKFNVRYNKVLEAKYTTK